MMVRRAELGSVVFLFGILIASTSQAVREYVWNPERTGAQNWSASGNWNLPGAPNDTTHVANLAVPITQPLAVNLGGVDVVLAGLTVGGTAVATDTQITN